MLWGQGLGFRVARIRSQVFVVRGLWLGVLVFKVETRLGLRAQFTGIEWHNMSCV